MLDEASLLEEGTLSQGDDSGTAGGERFPESSICLSAGMSIHPRFLTGSPSRTYRFMEQHNRHVLRIVCQSRELERTNAKKDQLQ